MYLSLYLFMRKLLIMEFDILGHLSPYTIINTTFNQFESKLVHSFPINSSRYTILEGYKKYLSVLRNVIETPFYQWIDGSFVTDKMNPNDIDVVTFIHHEVYFRKEHLLGGLISPDAKLIYQVDAAFVPVFPPNHRLRTSTEWDINF
jgi:hypothetical protein